MNKASWQKRLLGALSAAALGLGGAAMAQESPEGTSSGTGGSGQVEVEQTEVTETEVEPSKAEGTGGSGSSDQAQSGDGAFRNAEDIGRQEPGSSQEKREAMIGAESISLQEPGTGGSGGGMVDASEVHSPGNGMGARPDLTVALTVGLEGFTSHLGGVMMNGVSYGVRVGGRFWENVGLELEYSGTRAGVERDWAPQNGAAVYRNALDAVVTGGRTFESGLRPYGGLGFGVGRFNPNGFAEETFNGDWFTEVPLVAGIDYQFGPLSAGLRGTWRFLIGEEFANEARGIDATGNMLGVALNLGGQF